ncbi:MAG: lipoyl(octanoyl) transferase LipB [Proteobacteria bacterium]|nr:lipoyl(octanoyl) transferase LipB [Pseudomonadota bacterium]
MSLGELRPVLLDGLTPYDEAYALQLETVEQRKAKKIPNTLILLEHNPVITLGKSASDNDVLASPDILENEGIQLHRNDRGGQATYHGPGQVVGYPILDLHDLKIGVHDYVNSLEETIIRVAGEFGVEARRRRGIVGAYCDRGKIGAIGVRVTRGITFHGFSFNVCPDLAHYRFLVPCGEPDMPATSIAALKKSTPTIQETKRALYRTFQSVFG